MNKVSKQDKIGQWLDDVSVGSIICSYDLGSAMDITYRQAAHAISQRSDFIRLNTGGNRAKWEKITATIRDEA